MPGFSAVLWNFGEGINNTSAAPYATCITQKREIKLQRLLAKLNNLFHTNFPCRSGKLYAAYWSFAVLFFKGLKGISPQLHEILNKMKYIPLLLSVKVILAYKVAIELYRV